MKTLSDYSRERLEKVINYLEQLPASKFDFCEVGRINDKCGTIACIAGHLPYIFPAEVIVKYSEAHITGTPVAIEFWYRSAMYHRGAYAELFANVIDIRVRLAKGLTAPNSQWRCHPSLKTLGIDATPREAAQLLRDFMELNIS